MFHIAKVLKVLKSDDKNIVSADKTTVAMVRTWDENTLLLAVDENIADKIKENDYVLADYRTQQNTSSPRHLITKILKDSIGKDVWAAANAHFEEIKTRSGLVQSKAVKPQQYR
ncbi:hypothetical protein J4450_07785 [Candidatus Micrarchaeota archaeon]|nr:hypothetical protein [Candidatus Micrarchaeota archaeon]